MPYREFSPKELSDLIGLVYDSALEENQWQSLINKLSAYFPKCGIAVFGYDGSNTQEPYALAGASEETYRTFTPRLQHEHNLLIDKYAEIADLPLGFISRSQFDYAEGEFHRSSYYQNVIKPLGYDHYYSLKFAGAGQRYATMGFGILETEVEHNASLYELLKLLSGHLVRATKISWTLRLARESAEALSGFLDAIILPMQVTDTNGYLLFSNASGSRLLARGDLFTVDAAGRLCFSDEVDNRTLRKCIAEMDRRLSPMGMRVDRLDGPISICMTPFRASMATATRMDRDLIDTRKLFAIFVGQRQNDAINVGLLQDVFELTPREALVCRDLITGSSPADVANTTGRSLKTIRNQIQSVYEKVGVTSKTALADALSVFQTVGSMFEDQPGRDLFDVMPRSSL